MEMGNVQNIVVATVSTMVINVIIHDPQSRMCLKYQNTTPTPAFEPFMQVELTFRTVYVAKLKVFSVK